MSLHDVIAHFFQRWIIAPCLDGPQLVYPPSAEGHPGCSQGLVMMNEAAVNSHVHFFFFFFLWAEVSRSFGWIPRSVDCWIIGSEYVELKEAAALSHTVAAPLCAPTSCEWAFLSPQDLAVSVWDLSHSNGCVVAPHCFNLQFPNDMILKIFYLLFLEKERERNVNVWLLLICPQLGTWPATQACALTGNRTSDPLICRLVLSPLSHTSQDSLMTYSLEHLLCG